MEEQHPKSGMGPPKRSLDELIENMTADLNDSDGQYIQLGFTPPPTPASTHWATHNYLPQMTQPVYLPDHIAHPNDQPPFLNSRSHSQPSLGGIIPGRDISDGNYVNLVYGSPMGLYLLNDTPNTSMQQNLILNNYVPYRENDFGLFMNTPAQQPTTQPQMERNNGLIENLVGNWSSTGSGTYSPFGNGSTSDRMEQPMQATQPQPIPEERVVPKKRIVAEVKPMRPSYSDIVSKSPPTKTRTLSPNITKATDVNVIKPVKVTAKTKTVAGKKVASNLKRQHSGEEPTVQKIMTESVRSHSPAPMVFTRRVSLDLDSVQGDDDERPDSAQDSSSQSGDNSVRITQNTKSRAACNETRGGESGTPLNNHKVSKPGATKRPVRINNNLNPPPSSSEKNMKGGRPCKTCGEERRATNSTSGNNKNEGKSGQKTRSSSQGREKNSGNGGERTRKGGKNKKKVCPYSISAMWPVVHRHLMQWVAVAMQAVAWFLHLLSDVLGMSSKLCWHLCGAMYTKVKAWSGDAWIYIRATLNLPQQQQQHRKSRHRGAHHTPPTPPPWWARWVPSWFPWARKKPWEPANDGPTKLEVNLPLPATGEEAMKRLLACRGKDPYSILGVAPTCTDDDIKRYYKRQAFLVHPDKNSQPGAEEAFKILVHAFDLIGEPEKRQMYDCGVARSQQVGAAEWSELSDLLAQLHQKMEEAANTIRCTNCGKRHKRVPVDRPCYAARACAQCKIRHAAREGDIWAESTMLGFLWHYYACMEGAVYDITEWAACQADNLRHLRANSHAVQYRIVLGKKHQGSSSSRRPPEQPSEPDLEEFLNSFYGQQSGNTGGGSNSRSKDNDSPQRHSEHTRKRKTKRKK